MPALQELRAGSLQRLEKCHQIGQLLPGQLSVQALRHHRERSGPHFLDIRPSQPHFAAGAGHDFTALDQLLPHPVYARLYWVCVLNPSAATFEVVKPLLANAYGLAVSKYGKRLARHE